MLTPLRPLHQSATAHDLTMPTYRALLHRALQTIALLAFAIGQVQLDPSSSSLPLAYEFSGSSQGWSGTLGGVFTGSADVHATPAGTLEIIPPPLHTGASYFIDSEAMSLAYSDDAFIVLRLRTPGAGANPGTAALAFRDSPAPGPAASASLAAAAAGSAPLPYNYTWPSATTRTRTFATIGDGAFHTYAVPMHPSPRRRPYPRAPALTLLQLRLYPSQLPPSLGSSGAGASGGLGAPQSSAELDFLRIAFAPTLLKVEGCSPLLLWSPPLPNASSAGQQLAPLAYAPTALLQAPFRATRRAPYPLNRYYASSSAALSDTGGAADASLPWASTYNCARAGGDRVTLSGLHFGTATPRITIAGLPCTNVTLELAESRASCTLPALPGTTSGLAGGAGVPVTIANGDMPLLFDSKPLLRYAAPPPPPLHHPPLQMLPPAAWQWPGPSPHWTPAGLP